MNAVTFNGHYYSYNNKIETPIERKINNFSRKSKLITIPTTAKPVKIKSSIKGASSSSSSSSSSHGGGGPTEYPTTQDLQTFKTLLHADQKVAKLHFYLQDALGGQTATVWEVAHSAITDSSATSFGQVRVVDDLITAQPEKDSQKLGRAQGTITMSGLDESALTMNLNFYFTAGEFSGSTLCIVGRNPISRKNRELPVVGGTGVFRMGRGYSISNTYSYDAEKNYGVLEYTVYVAYADEDR